MPCFGNLYNCTEAETKKLESLRAALNEAKVRP